MATKKKIRSKTPRGSASAAGLSHATAESSHIQAAGTASMVGKLIPSKPATEQIAATSSSESAATESTPPPVAGKLGAHVESIVAKAFQSNPDKEFTVNAVIAELKRTDPGINENSVRFTITELKRKSIIHRVRNEGYYQILKFTKPGEGKPFLRPPGVDKPSTKTAPKASPADIASDLAVLKEATTVIFRLQAMVHRNQDILTHISKLKAVL